MITDETYHRAGVPTSILGCSYKSWRRAQLITILDHYAEPYPEGATKLDLMNALHTLSQRQPLTRRDKSRILNPQLRSMPLELGDVESSSPSEENAPTPEAVLENHLVISGDIFGLSLTHTVKMKANVHM